MSVIFLIDVCCESFNSETKKKKNRLNRSWFSDGHRFNGNTVIRGHLIQVNYYYYYYY